MCVFVCVYFRVLSPCVVLRCRFAKIRELEPVLCRAGRASQLIWTSSSNAQRSAFDLEDVQHRAGVQLYSSSKYATDLLSLALNTRYNKQVGTHTHTHTHTHITRVFRFIPVDSRPLGFVLIRHLSGFRNDQPDLRHPALLPGRHLDSAHAPLVARES